MDDQRTDREGGVSRFRFSLRSGLIAVALFTVWFSLTFGGAVFKSAGRMPDPLWESWICFGLPAIICMPIIAIAAIYGRAKSAAMIPLGTSIALLLYRWIF